MAFKKNRASLAMQLVAVSLSLMFICLPQATSNNTNDGSVAVLTSANFVELSKKSSLLVLFYSPWCQHSQAILPEFESALSAINLLDADIVVAKVDITVEEDLAQQFFIDSPPILSWLVDGEAEHNYSGDPTRDGILAWVRKLLGGAATVLITSENAQKATKENEVAVFGYFENFDSGGAHEAYNKLALEMDDVAFFRTTDASIAKDLGIMGAAPGFSITRNHPGHLPASVTFEGHKASLNESLKLSERLENFLYAEKLPDYLVYDVDRLEEVAELVNSVPIAHHMYVVAGEGEGAEGSPLVKAVQEAGQRLRGDVVVLLYPHKKGESSPLTEIFQVDANDFSMTRVLGAEMVKIHKFTCDIVGILPTADSLIACGRSFVDGTAPRIFSTAPAPKEPVDNDGTSIVVGSTLNAIAKDPTKDVLLEVYAPWCGACKAFAPTYRRLAAALANVSSVVIAKMDGSTNEHADVDVEYYPTLVFFPAVADATPMLIDSEEFDLGLQGLVDFLKVNAKVPFEVPDLELLLKEESEEEQDGPSIDLNQVGEEEDEDEEATMLHEEL